MCLKHLETGTVGKGSMRYDEEKARKMAALKAELARHSRRDRMALATVTALAVAALAVLLAHLSGLMELPDLR
jgi:hypothetical protein